MKTVTAYDENGKRILYVRRPPGHQLGNDAWMCSICGMISREVNRVFHKHLPCPGGYAIALIEKRK